SSKGNWVAACGRTRPEDEGEANHGTARIPPTRPFRKVRRELMSAPVFLTLKLYSPQLELRQFNVMRRAQFAKKKRPHGCAHNRFSAPRKLCRQTSGVL